jgi:hypothetical protein
VSNRLNNCEQYIAPHVKSFQRLTPAGPNPNQGTFKKIQGNIQGTFKEHSGNIQGNTQRNIQEKIQGTFRETFKEHSGNILEIKEHPGKHSGKHSGNFQSDNNKVRK